MFLVLCHLILKSTPAITVNFTPEDWKSSKFCNTNCRTKVPCIYPDEVDLRIIAMGATRAESLTQALNSINSLETMGDRVAVEVWLDRLKDGTIH